MEHLRITVEGKAYDVIVEKISQTPASAVPQPAAPLARSAPVTQSTAPAIVPAATPVPVPATASAGDAVSPLAGIVQAVDASVGSSVHEGDLVLTLEAMKMYTPINAVASGTITAIHVKVGDAVEEGQVLYTIG